MSRPWVLYIPLVGVIIGVVRHSRACTAHKKACEEYHKQDNVWNDSATWVAFDNVFKELDNAMVGLLSFVIGFAIIFTLGAILTSIFG